MTSQRDMRCLTERFIRRHAQQIDILDADRLAAGLERYMPLELRGGDSLSNLRTIVIDVASQSFLPTRWGRLGPGGDGAGGAGRSGRT